MEQRLTDEIFMRRCLQLAVNGRQGAKPNPMVGAVIVSADHRIIGEGYHAHFGKGHAEVNAFASVRPVDEPLLAEATLYVSLEPCSHWGKTPPCADLIVSKGIRRVVCGCIDPFSEVRGKGIRRLQEAGIAVTVGVLEEQCKRLIRRFVVCNTYHRPYIILKWAQTINGFMGAPSDGQATDRLRISTPFTEMLVHKLRAENDAILIGRRTLDRDRPSLNVRHWSGTNPLPIVLTRHPRKVPAAFKLFTDIDEALDYLSAEHLQSLLVEGGSQTLQSFLERNLWDEIRVETAPFVVHQGVSAPALPKHLQPISTECYDGHLMQTFARSEEA